ncbi:Myosin II heavy chain-like protein [Cynara cardunculus var. scolymus]|uniref:Myosin II heavy chain-like protein n=1 Tax=Cynara cardunculus var. scolymus TaxID=59895 RepID=A0A118JY96_CYNCS|nr:Myosin II heavy chain-like protein [Cynara cardunculus var. scolymus]
MVGFDECLPLSQADPVILELNRLHNLLKGVLTSVFWPICIVEKERELGIAQTEIKALKAADKLATEKKEAFAAQFAAEATLRRVHASQKDDNSVPIESIIAPLEADIRMNKNEIAVLQEDKKTLERHAKLKEAALLEAERILRSALERALIVEEEENKILEKTNRQKVLEVEKLSETIKELEEAILVGGAAANGIRDYRRQISELQEEKRTLERELARANVSANRVATTVANEWKDKNDQVMPAEMQRLRDKLTISERTAKSEAQLKDKVKLRLKTLEDGLKQSTCGSPKLEKSNHFFGILSSNGGRKRSMSQPRGGSSTISQKSDVDSQIAHASGEMRQVNSVNKKHASGENLLKKSLWASRSKVVDGGDEKENNEMILENTSGMNLNKFKDERSTVLKGRETASGGSEERQERDSRSSTDDVVSGFLYDRLQKEMLMKKVENLIKALEVESKKWKREATTRDKNSTSIKTEENKPVRNLNSSKRDDAEPVGAWQLIVIIILYAYHYHYDAA